MREHFEILYQEQGIQPEPHYYIIGMYTGEATLGNVGSFKRREFTALGILSIHPSVCRKMPQGAQSPSFSKHWTTLAISITAVFRISIFP